MDIDDHPIDLLLHAVRRARESADPSRVDRELATTVLAALLDELPVHFGADAHAAYAFWLRNRIEALHTNQPFRRWLTTSSYQRSPELLTYDPTQPPGAQPGASDWPNEQLPEQFGPGDDVELRVLTRAHRWAFGAEAAGVDGGDDGAGSFEGGLVFWRQG